MFKIGVALDMIVVDRLTGSSLYVVTLLARLIHFVDLQLPRKTPIVNKGSGPSGLGLED